MVLGYRADDDLDFNSTEFLHPDDTIATINAVQYSIKTGQPFNADYRLLHCDKNHHWVNGRGNTFYDDTGRAIYFTGVLTNIDDRR
ncbi:MAG: PAS domain-containing protein [Parasphingorhabdus sp.]